MKNTYNRFEHPGLTRTERKVCEMLFNRFTRDEIMDEMDMSAGSLAKHFSNARKKGVAIPHGSCGKIRGVPIARLVKMRDALVREYGTKHGVHLEIASELGMRRNAVTQRLRLYDLAHKRAA